MTDLEGVLAGGLETELGVEGSHPVDFSGGLAGHLGDCLHVIPIQITPELLGLLQQRDHVPLLVLPMLKQLVKALVHDAHSS